MTCMTKTSVVIAMQLGSGAPLSTKDDFLAQSLMRGNTKDVTK